MGSVRPGDSPDMPISATQAGARRPRARSAISFPAQAPKPSTPGTPPAGCGPLWRKSPAHDGNRLPPSPSLDSRRVPREVGRNAMGRVGVGLDRVRYGLLTDARGRCGSDAALFGSAPWIFPCWLMGRVGDDRVTSSARLARAVPRRASAHRRPRGRASSARSATHRP